MSSTLSINKEAYVNAAMRKGVRGTRFQFKGGIQTFSPICLMQRRVLIFKYKRTTYALCLKTQALLKSDARVVGPSQLVGA